MRILLLTHGFNSLTQRLFEALAVRGHEVSVEFDIADSVTEEAVALFQPDVLLAPFLKRAIPESLWSRQLCLIVHPGIVGDRGPSALDWAIQSGAAEWGVTVLQAEAEMDAGPVWATSAFPMRAAKKSSLYRNEVTEAALAAVLEALDRVDDWRTDRWQPRRVQPGDGDVRGGLQPLMRQADRAIDWLRDGSAQILARLRAADGFPGVADNLFGVPCHLFDAHPAPLESGAIPGALLARRDGAVLRATIDGAVWIGHVKRGDRPDAIKLPATVAFAAEAAGLPERPSELWRDATDDGAELRYREEACGTVGVLSFDFYNGAMATDQCRRLIAAIDFARSRPTRVLVLEGGADFWSNGIHLNRIEAVQLDGGSAADASWDNINAMDDVCLAILQLTDRLTVAALRGNAGAGGCFLALAADQVWARDGVILNPHYKNMGNLYGSEYWTYLLPRRVGADGARAIMAARLPLGAPRAVEGGLIDACFGADRPAFEGEVLARATALAAAPDYAERLAAKQARRAADEAAKPLAAYRDEELAHMRRNFYGFDPSYHGARYHFVMKSPQSWTPRHLARHREVGR
ncbi:hydrogenase maturation protein [Zoogloea sp.]|uniref:hydrogenase maturation protein n=1 Tax=Zoogloea sp. TaxID=49181 RepID=UPI0035AECCE6